MKDADIVSVLKKYLKTKEGKLFLINVLRDGLNDKEDIVISLSHSQINQSTKG